MFISLKILESNKVIENNILRSLLPEIKDYMDGGITRIKKELPPLILNSIISSEEYRSLNDGQLKYELGIPDAMNKINGLLGIWTSNMQINYSEPSIKSSKIKSSFSIEMIKSDFSDVLGTDYAIVNDNQRGYSLPWLEWLLLSGSKSLIKDYQVIIGPNKFSRTGMAVMRQYPSASWSVPSDFAGTISDNWITRAIDKTQDQIMKILDGAFK